MMTSDFGPEVEIRPFHACAMHPAIITGTVRSLLTWLWGRYHVPQNAFLVTIASLLFDFNAAIHFSPVIQRYVLRMLFPVSRFNFLLYSLIFDLD